MISDLKKNYRNFFLEQSEKILKEVVKLRPSNFSGDIFEKYDKNSLGFLWQKEVLKYFEEEIKSGIESQICFVKKTRANYECAKCGICCKFACSEFSPDELVKKATNGDKTAKEFIDTFVPYDSIADAKKIYPDYIKFLENNSDGKFYIYHCPKITDENTCSCYESRPKICRNFPDNPVEFFPPNCGFMGWKNNCENILLEVRAKIEIYEFYKNKIKGLI